MLPALLGLVSLLASPHAGAADCYFLLENPLTQESQVKLSDVAIGGFFTMSDNYVYSGIAAAGAYEYDHDFSDAEKAFFSTLLVTSGSDLVWEAPLVGATVVAPLRAKRALMSPVKEIVQDRNIKKLRMLSSSQVAMKGLLPKGLTTRAYLFAQADCARPPRVFRGQKFLPLGEDAKAVKFETRLGLGVNPAQNQLAEKAGNPLETGKAARPASVTLDDLFHGSALETDLTGGPEAQKAWKETLEDWEKSGHWKDLPKELQLKISAAVQSGEPKALQAVQAEVQAKLAPRSGLVGKALGMLDEVKRKPMKALEARLILPNGTSIDLGNVASGEAVEQFIENEPGKIQKAVRFVKSGLAKILPGINAAQPQGEPPPGGIQAREIPLVNSECASLYDRLMDASMRSTIVR
jgi:hypothetical protein